MIAYFIREDGLRQDDPARCAVFLRCPSSGYRSGRRHCCRLLRSGPGA